MAQTKEERKTELQKQVKAAENLKNHKALARKAMYGIGILAVAGVISAGGMLVSSSSAKEAYQAMADGGVVNYEFLDYEDTFDKWNSTALGNDINVLLSGGKVCLQEGGTAMAVKPKQGQATVISGASYINKHGNEYIYRDDHSRKIIAINPQSHQKRVLFDGNAGEVVCEDDTGYFINLGDEGTIYRLNLKEGNEPEKIIDKSVQSFASIGGSILYLTTDDGLYIMKHGEKVAKLLSQHVERFFVAGRILAESQDKIMSFTPLGNDAKLIYQSANKGMRMIGYQQGNIYIQEDGQLYELSSDEKKLLIDVPHSLYGSLDIDAEGRGFVYEQAIDGNGKFSEAVVPVVKGDR